MAELAFAYKNNAELIDACHRLGYVGGSVVDLTYGLGRFWTVHRPERFVTNDLFTPAKWSHDYTNLPKSWYGRFDTTVFDPPYKLNGTGGAGPGDAAYGVALPYKRWQDKHGNIKLGIANAIRITKPGGFVLVKCMDQVCSGKVRWQTREFADFAEYCGTRLVDMAFVEGYRAQDASRRQVHFRRNYSTMLIFRKDRKK